MDDWSRRNGIATTLDVSDRLGRQSPDVELTVFRLVEDALANISERSGSATARVCVDQSQSPSEILMTVEDAGKGLPGATGLRGLARATKPIAALRGIGLAREPDLPLHRRRRRVEGVEHRRPARAEAVEEIEVERCRAVLGRVVQAQRA